MIAKGTAGENAAPARPCALSPAMRAGGILGSVVTIDSSRQGDDMSDELVEIYSALNEVEAYFVRDLLVNAEIEARVINDNQAWAGETLASAAIQPKVMVHSGDRIKATAIVNEFDEHAYRQAQAASSEQEEEDTSKIVGKVSKDPCGKCGAPRLGVCSYCNGSSAEFVDRSDDFEPDEPGGEVEQLICPVCAEPTVPRWSASCSECDEPFPAG